MKEKRDYLKVWSGEEMELLGLETIAMEMESWFGKMVTNTLVLWMKAYGTELESVEEQMAKSTKANMLTGMQKV